MATADLHSSIPYFKAALKTTLEAADAMKESGTGVFRGRPEPASWPRRSVVIENAQDRNLEYTCCMTQANETYRIRVACNVASNAQSAYPTLEDEAYALADDLCQAVLVWNASKPVVTGDWGQVSTVVPKTGEDEEGLGDTTREATVFVYLNVTARLS